MLMKVLLRRYWLLVSPIYWAATVGLLWHACPPSTDGSGPMATFYWGKHSPTPTLSEYHDNLSVQLKFIYPYLFAAVIVTLLGCGAASWITRRFKLTQSRHFLASVGISLSLFLLTAAISDTGGKLGLWFGPRIYYDLFSVLVLLKVTLPVAFASGLLSLGYEHLIARS